MSRSDHELIGDALAHLDALRRHVARGDLDDEPVADAVSLRLAACIEAISETTNEFRARVFGEEWRIIWATRNRIAHGYAFIDRRLIQETVDRDLPGFEKALRAEFARDVGPSGGAG